MIGEIILLLISMVVLFDIIRDVLSESHRHTAEERKWQRMVRVATIKDI